MPVNLGIMKSLTGDACGAAAPAPWPPGARSTAVRLSDTHASRTPRRCLRIVVRRLLIRKDSLRIPRALAVGSLTDGYSCLLRAYAIRPYWLLQRHASHSAAAT